MREIKFRGINNDGNWCFGDLIQSNNNHNVWIHAPKINHTYKVAPATVGQFTGLCDCEGCEIYEGDVVAFGDFRKAHDIENEYWHDVVKWDNKHARFILDTLFFDDVFSNELLIIGNVHDSPELLEVEHD